MYGSASDYKFTASGVSAIQQTERYTLIPSGAISSTPLTINAYDKLSYTLLGSAITNIVAAASSANSGVTKKLIAIGDSLVGGGVITSTLMTIAASDVMKLTCLGTQGASPAQHEGRGGWSAVNYTNAGPTYYSFSVSGVTVNPNINSTHYTNNGADFLVQTVNLSGGAGTIICSLTSGTAPGASGTLTKVGSITTGDATIAFSAYATVPGNPFWISGALNFAQYLTNNGFSAPD